MAALDSSDVSAAMDSSSPEETGGDPLEKLRCEFCNLASWVVDNGDSHAMAELQAIKDTWKSLFGEEFASNPCNFLPAAMLPVGVLKPAAQSLLHFGLHLKCVVHDVSLFCLPRAVQSRPLLFRRL
ncbi:hypothetical protein Salat_0832500 [Sesamum alatum]|uniref:Uncharacterized protein n=1 Tax=Sesamum alatum TaxID=300844 RepID=A0AAE1YJK4_9LAMI|nr:hypothetical protein Salat_0832500 [Sesamum alatum]